MKPDAEHKKARLERFDVPREAADLLVGPDDPYLKAARSLGKARKVVKRWQPHTVRLCAYLYAKGVGVTEIGRITGLKRHTVYVYLERWKEMTTVNPSSRTDGEKVSPEMSREP